MHLTIKDHLLYKEYLFVDALTLSKSFVLSVSVFTSIIGLFCFSLVGLSRFR